jgi:hypothetical protein
VLFVGERSAGWIGGAILDGWTFKVLCALADTPLCYAVIYGYRSYLRLDPGSEATLYEGMK